MSATAEHPSPAVLRRFSTFSVLPDDTLDKLSAQLFVHEQHKGATLLALGSTDERLLFLVDGDCRVVAADGVGKSINHADPSAKVPLARLRPSRYRIEAGSTVRYLLVEPSLINADADGRPSAATLGAYCVEEEDDAGPAAAENLLTMRIYEDLNADRVLLPSLPRVAARIGAVVNEDNADSRKVATLIESDPAIAVKIVKAANSARFGGVSSLGNVGDAVTRLGMENTRSLVIAFALRELFRNSGTKLDRRMFALWEHSRRIGALAKVLASRIGGFNPNEALLAGLVHDIGVLAVISYARDFPELVEDDAIFEASVHSLRNQLNGMILSKWKLPERMIVAAREAENWGRQHDGKPDYGDLVIVAQVHDGVAGDIDVASVPAVARLGLEPGDIGHGVELLHTAHEEVAAAKRLLAG